MMVKKERNSVALFAIKKGKEPEQSIQTALKVVSVCM